jgi:hypothetical protein
MDDKQFCEEVRRVLKEIGPEGKNILRKILKEQDRHNSHRILKFRRLKNLVEYLLNLGEDNKEER